MEHYVLLLNILILGISGLWQKTIARVQFQIDQNCECGESKEGLSARIVGGIQSIPHNYPWTVPILKRGRIHCGGTIINDRYVLTAGHCVKWTNHSLLTVGIGVHDLRRIELSNTALIEKVILHENFTSDAIHDINDLALLKLTKPIQFSRNVKVVCLPKKGSTYTNNTVKVIGWGRTLTRGNLSNVMRVTTLKVMSSSDCQHLPFGEYVTESMICAYGENADACQGDSGGPLVQQREDRRYEQIGIISWGIGCARKGQPGVYVKNIDYLNWIIQNSLDGVFCLDPADTIYE